MKTVKAWILKSVHFNELLPHCCYESEVIGYESEKQYIDRGSHVLVPVIIKEVPSHE